MSKCIKNILKKVLNENDISSSLQHFCIVKEDYFFSFSYKIGLFTSVKWKINLVSPYEQYLSVWDQDLISFKVGSNLTTILMAAKAKISHTLLVIHRSVFGGSEISPKIPLKLRGLKFISQKKWGVWNFCSKWGSEIYVRKYVGS